MQPIFDGNQLIRTLFRISGILVICHLLSLVMGDPSWQWERLFDLGYDNNIPTWFSSALWALAAFTAYRYSGFSVPPAEKRLWIFVALGFLVLSIDEVAMIHESIFRTIGRVLPLDM